MVPRGPSSILPAPCVAPTTCLERVLTFRAGQGAAGHSGRRRRRGRSLPPPRHLLGWPPQEARQRRRGASRWVPASRSCHFPQHQRLLPVPSSLAGPGGRRRLQARSLHRLLVTAACAAPLAWDPPRSAAGPRLCMMAGLLRAGPGSSPAIIVFTWPFIAFVEERRRCSPAVWKTAPSCLLWTLEKCVHASSLSRVVSTLCSCLLHLQPHDPSAHLFGFVAVPSNAQALSSSRLSACCCL